MTMGQLHPKWKHNLNRLHSLPITISNCTYERVIAHINSENQVSSALNPHSATINSHSLWRTSEAKSKPIAQSCYISQVQFPSFLACLFIVVANVDRLLSMTQSDSLLSSNCSQTIDTELACFFNLSQGEMSSCGLIHPVVGRLVRSQSSLSPFPCRH